MFDFGAKVAAGLPYEEFLKKYATPEQHRRWSDLHAKVTLTELQRGVLSGFQRQIKLLCLAGAWCGDCVQQCPIFDHFAAATDRLELLFFDRDDHLDLQDELTICGGARVPSVVFLNEDNQPLSRFGDRTLAKYRQMALDLPGAACPTGLVPPEENLLDAVVQEWLNELERVHLIARTSPRLREKHGD